METEIKIHIAAVIVGFFLDLWIGDPERWPHPVRAMGWLIGRLEGMFRKISPKTLQESWWLADCSQRQ